MTKSTTATRIPLSANLQLVWQDVDSSFERFCLMAGIGAIEQMFNDDAQELTGAPYSRGEHRIGQRWGTTKGKIGFHGGKVTVHRPRVRGYDGREVELPTWTAAQAEDWPLGDEPDADQRLDAQAAARGATAGWRSASGRRRRHLEVGGLHGGSWLCRPTGWPSGWHPTCPS
jgi:hypothetical protein